MVDFVNPFSGMVPGRKLSDRELIRALRLSLSAEEEAVHLYEALADATDNKLAKTVLQDIANEEKVHAGEFQQVLKILLKDEEKWLQEGAEEVAEMAEDVKAEEKEAAKPPEEIPTVGDMKE